MQGSGLMGGSDEKWMVREGPERVEDWGEGEELYTPTCLGQTEV